MKNAPQNIDLSLLARQYGARHIPFHPHEGAHWQNNPALQEALKELNQAAALRSVLLLSGPNGVGKSALLTHWINGLDTRRYEPLIFTQATLSGSSLLSALTAKLGKRPSCRRERNLILIEEALVELEHRIAIIVLDEAQHYTYAALEEIRLLLGLNLHSQPAFALTLIGDDYFPKTLAMRHHRSLYSRIAFNIKLPHWAKDQIQEYIAQSLKAAGLPQMEFEPAALELILSSAGGLPRALTLLARNAWIAAASAKATTMSAEHVRKAIDQVPCLPGAQFPTPLES
jgi:type II secretory pathway predicted ATPase ExeA